MKKLNITKTETELKSILRAMSDEMFEVIVEADEAGNTRKLNALLKKVNLTRDEWDFLGY